MKIFLNKVLNLRKGEYVVTFLMFSYLYLLLVTYYLLKPARDSLFLDSVGITLLPVVFMLIAVVVIPINTVYSIASKKLKLNRLINSTTIIIIACLFVLRWLIVSGATWVFYTFYIWVSIYGVLTVSQFWLFANAVYNPAQAKRLFVLLNLGAILGAFTGGEVTSIIVKNLGIATENLLFFCMAFLGVCVVLINIIWSMKKNEIEEAPVKKIIRDEPKENFAEVFSTIKKSRHLLLIAGIIAMTMGTASFVDYQFKAVADAAFDTRADMTSFFGKFYGRLSLISLFLQLLFSYRILRVLGVGGIIMFLPLGLLLGSVFMLFVPGLLAGVLLRGSDGAFKYSLDKTGRELLFLPVPLDVKKKTKIFIDVIVDRWFRGVAGGALLLFVTVMGFSVRQLSVVVLIMLVLWLILVFMMRKEYVNTFRKAIEKREIDPAELRTNISDAATITALRNSIKSKNDREVVYALGMLSSVDIRDFISELLPLTAHDSSEVRLKSLEVLQEYDHPKINEAAKKLLRDNDQEIVVDALCYLHAHTDNPENFLSTYLADNDKLLKSAVIACIAKIGNAKEKALVTDEIIQSALDFENGQSSQYKINVANALPDLSSSKINDYLLRLAQDNDTNVVKHAIRSLGKLKARENIPFLMKMLENKKLRGEAITALAEYEDSVIGTLNDYLNDSKVSLSIRRNIPRILYNIPSDNSVQTLVENLAKSDPLLRFAIIKALNKLRAKYPDLNFRVPKVDGALLEETKNYYAILHILDKDKNAAPGSDALKLLRKALNEKLDFNLEKIFRLLGLLYPHKDIFNAYQGITSTKKNLQASAVEFLDNILDKEQKKYLMPLLDSSDTAMAINFGKRKFHLHFESFENAVTYLIQGNDAWLSAVAIHYAIELKLPELSEVIKTIQNPENNVVKEVVEKII